MGALHSHRWRIEEPNGETSLGTCKCGATREFRNFGASLDDGNGWKLRNGKLKPDTKHQRDAPY